MNNDIDIQCENMVVEFPLFDSVSRSVKARMTGETSHHRSFRALDGITLTIKKGERVGFLGAMVQESRHSCGPWQGCIRRKQEYSKSTPKRRACLKWLLVPIQTQAVMKISRY